MRKLNYTTLDQLEIGDIFIKFCYVAPKRAKRYRVDGLPVSNVVTGGHTVKCLDLTSIKPVVKEAKLFVVKVGESKNKERLIARQSLNG